MVRTSAVVIVLLLTFYHIVAQQNPLTDSLKVNLETSKSAEQKAFWLAQLSSFYFSVNRKLSDEYAMKLQQIAEESRDRKLLVFVHLSNSRRFASVSGRQDNINKSLEYAQHALELARDSNLKEYEAWAYNALAYSERQNSANDKSLNYNNLALAIANSSDNDSLKVLTLSSLGNTYMAKEEKLLAFRNFLAALEIAENADNFYLLRAAYTNLSRFYDGLGEHEKSKDFLFKTVQVTRRFNKKIERIEAYNALARVYGRSMQFDLAAVYFDKAVALADSINFELIKLNTYGSMLDMYVGSDQAEKALNHINSKPELKKFMVTAGFKYFIDLSYAMAFMDAGKMDSAEYYLKMAEPDFVKSASKGTLFWFYSNAGRFYKRKSDYKVALEYTMKADNLAEASGDIHSQKNTSRMLDSLYQKLGDFKSAYHYNKEYQRLNDTLDILSTEKDVMLMEVETENKRKEREALLKEQARLERHNIQYMGITFAIVAVFIVLVMLGIFSVSHSTIRIMGFFAFIFLFEFLILIADNQIHHWTHGEPWKILLIKIGLISILLPLHHYLEEKVIHYLTSKKLLEINKEAIFSKFVTRKDAE